MARDLDDAVLAARLHLDDVASFVRDVERATPVPSLRREPAGAENELPTRRDLLMPARLWIGGRFSARRAALVTGLGLALAAGAFGWGLKPHPARARPSRPRS
jgi:hypothetical protein